MSVCRFLVFPWFGVFLSVAPIVSAQQNFGVVQGRIAEETKEVPDIERINPRRYGVGVALTVPVSINGSKTSWWIVDTGAPVCIIDPSFAKKLSLQADSNVGRVPVTMVSGLQIGNFRCDGIACGVRSMSDLRSVALKSGESLEKTGMVGVNLLAKYGGLINCRTQQVFFSPSGNLGMSREKYEQLGFSYIPMNVTRRNRLEVVGTLNGKEFSFFLDTGAYTTLLDNSIRNGTNFPTSSTNRAAKGPFHDFGRLSGVTAGEATDFKLGSYDAKGARIGFTSLNLPETGSAHRFAGLLGMDFLFYRSAIIDVGGRALYLKESTRAR